MKFKIYWIDDSTTWFKSMEAEVKDAFTEKGFIPKIEHHPETASAKISILNSYADLILVDCNLPNSSSGDEFIKDLRENRCFSHVIFYSEDANNLGALIEDKHFLHVARRSDISAVVEEVAEQAYRKYHHPAFMRGLLLSEFIDLENSLENFIVSSFRAEGDYFRNMVINKGGESYSLMAKVKFISDLISDEKGKWGGLLSDQLDEIKFTRSGFEKKIIMRRNILAHAYPKYDEATGEITLVSPKASIEFDSNWFHETRESIHEYKTKIKSLLELKLPVVE